MTAPLDIGLEQHDASLSLGQEDLFDLGGAEQGLSRRGGLKKFTSNQESGLDGEHEGLGDDGDEDVEYDPAAKLAAMELELDGMYDAYQGRLRERDAKFKVSESRKRNAEREEWVGIQGNTENNASDEEPGGWEEMERAKRDVDESSSDDSDDDDDIRPNPQKRPRDAEVLPGAKRPRLVSNLDGMQPPSSQNAKVWFSQDVFGQIDQDLSNLTDDDSDDDSDDEEIADKSEAMVSTSVPSFG
jgi:AdoMet-dependent rRNA methyltransferase SPB1